MRIDSIYSKLHGTKHLSTLNVRSDYCDITVAENSQEYPAFMTEYGKYELLYAPFGIHLAPSYFTIMISETL